LSDIATVIGAVGGAAVTALWKAGTNAFSIYAVGLAIGFFGYLIASISLKTPGTMQWLGGNDAGAAAAEQVKPGD
jgi:hypothetical protein